jgi:hypothetical protein
MELVRQLFNVKTHTEHVNTFRDKIQNLLILHDVVHVFKTEL